MTTCTGTHHPGCACHEARRDAELADLRDKLTEAIAQRDHEAWMHAACLTIAETGSLWGEGVQPSAAMLAVADLRAQLAAANATLAKVREACQPRPTIHLWEHHLLIQGTRNDFGAEILALLGEP